MPRKLAHYLRTERRRAALTQADITALLGVPWKTRVSRYEHGALPPIEAALAYEAILGVPVSDLLGGTSDRIAFEVRRRAQELLEKANVANTPRRLRRRQSLEHIAA